jgi:ornithine carbamoyltransferase
MEKHMAFNLRNRSLVSLMHHSTRELRYLLDMSRDLKRAKYSRENRSKQHLQRRKVSTLHGDWRLTRGSTTV